MPSSFFWMFGLLAVLFVVGRRFLRRRTTLTEYKFQQEARLRRMLEEGADVHLSDDEALMPVLASVRDIPLPAGVCMSVQTERRGTRVQLVGEDGVLLTMMLTYSRVAPLSSGDGRKFPNGAWHLRLDYTGKSGQDVFALGKTSDCAGEHIGDCAGEYFDELAPFATRVENLIRSLHDRPC